MESPPPPLQPQPSIDADAVDSNSTVEKHTKPNTTTKPPIIKKRIKSNNNNNKRKDVRKPQMDPPQQSVDSVSSSSSTSTVLHSRPKGIRISSTNRRNPRVFNASVTNRRNGGEADALALPLGMSIAAFVAQVLEKKDTNGERMSADYLSEICTLAVKESLSNMSSNLHFGSSSRKRFKSNSNKKMLAFMAKQITSVIPTIVSQIQASSTPNDSADSHVSYAKTNFSFKHFIACNPEPFTGEEGVAKMFEWFDSIELTFINSECPDHFRTRSATGVFKLKAQTWWTTERKKRGNDAAFALPWEEVKQLMTVKFCPPHEMQVLEEEFWNLKQVGGENATYTTRFKQLSILVPHLVNTTERAITKYVNGLPPAIRDVVTVCKSDNLEETYQMAAKITNNHVKDGTLTRNGLTKTINQAITKPTVTKPKTHLNGKKRKLQTRNYVVVTPPNPIPNNLQPMPNHIPNSEPIRKVYTGTLPKCNTCQYHHLATTACWYCIYCNRFGHLTATCRNAPRAQGNPNPPQIQHQAQPFIQNPPQIQNPRPQVNHGRACYQCGDLNHLSPQCPQCNLQAQVQLPRGRAFVINAAQPQNDNDVVNGMLWNC